MTGRLTLPTPVLRLDGLRVGYPGRRGQDAVDAVHDLSLVAHRGETVAIVGESGSGKSSALHALLGLLPARARADWRSLQVAGPDAALRRIDDPRALRGALAGLVPQDPAQALDPLVRIEGHFRELYRYVEGVSDRDDARRRTVDALDAVGIDRPEHRLRQYPHELSGGQRQRVLIALALIGRPRLLLADEPTSNLDATVQRRVLDLLDALRVSRGLSIVLVTHDLAVAAERSTRLVVLHRGRVVEAGPTAEILRAPAQPYTRALLDALPSRLPTRPRRLVDETAPLLSARELSKTFAGRGGAEPVTAVESLSLTLRRGRTLALVGESGAGKSTALRLLTGLEVPDGGELRIAGEPVDARRRRRGALARRVQLVYQNPRRSLDPALTVAEAIAEPLVALDGTTRSSRRADVRRLLDDVGLPAALGSRRTRELSGGQAQRVAIARALAPSPEIVFLDEPVSALDQSVQFQILALLGDLQSRLGLSYVLVSHDLGVVRAVADDVIVLHRGRVVEHADTASVFRSPTSPHTRALLDALPAHPHRAGVPDERTG